MVIWSAKEPRQILKIEADLEAGNLVDNRVVNELVESTIKTTSDGSYLISDGFPRDLEQAKWLDEFCSFNDCEINKVLLININDATAIARLGKRGRDDDDRATIEHRLEVFHTRTDDVIDYYQSSQRLSEVNGEATPDKVADEIEKILEW